MVLAAQDLLPPATADPTGVWFFNWVIPIVGSIFIVLAIADVIRRRRLTWGFLFLFNSLAVYWMETVGDWGQMLFYSPAFAEHHLLEWLPLKTPERSAVHAVRVRGVLGCARPAGVVAEPVGLVAVRLEHAQIDDRACHSGELRLGFRGRGHRHRDGMVDL